MTAKKNLDKTAAMTAYIAEIDRFATILRDQQVNIAQLEAECAIAKKRYEDAKARVKEANDYEHSTVSLLLKFITPGSIDILPLFDRMETANEDKHGENADEWRKEPITALNLSAAAMRALIAADIVLVGQLQDLVLKGPDWAKDIAEINDGMAQAIEAKLDQFIEERKTTK